MKEQLTESPADNTGLASGRLKGSFSGKRRQYTILWVEVKK